MEEGREIKEDEGRKGEGRKTKELRKEGRKLGS